MLRCVVLLALFGCVVSLKSFDELPEELKQWYIPQLIAFHADLNETERFLVKEIFKGHEKFRDAEKIASDINEKAPKLALRFARIREMFGYSFDELGPEVRTFIKEFVKKTGSLNKEINKGNPPSATERKLFRSSILDHYKTLSAEAKNELSNHFRGFARDLEESL